MTSAVFASTTNGTIDATKKYAWGSKIGWLNFDTTGGQVQITDLTLTGYVWSENYGWINLSPEKSGVKNDGQGNLSGYAWGENLGWINFSSVVINSSGRFTGMASGDNVGIVNFDCEHCDVTTDWRPRYIRPQCSNALDDDSDGNVDFPIDPGCSSITDNDETNSAGGGGSIFFFQPSLVVISDETEIKTVVEDKIKKTSITEDFTTTTTGGIIKLVKSAANRVGDFLNQTVKNVEENIDLPTSQTVFDLPIFSSTKGLGSNGINSTMIMGSLMKQIAFILPDFYEISNLSKSKMVSNNKISHEVPQILTKQWETLSVQGLEQSVLAPWPLKVLSLQEKFQEAGKIFNSISIQRLTGWKKLEQIKLALPSIRRLAMRIVLVGVFW